MDHEENKQHPFNPHRPFEYPRRNHWGGNAFWHRYESYEPWYDDKADYNTNAKSYYDYLARFNAFLREVVDAINRLLRRDIKFNDSKSIDFDKIGDWLDHGNCDNYDDLIEVTAKVIISRATEKRTLKNTSKKEFTVPNGSKIVGDGLWSPDYIDLINSLDDSVGDIYKKISNMGDQIANLQNALQKIVNNLYDSGAITSNNINNFDFKKGRDIATGNINLFGGSADGNSFIRTNKGKTENDITAGI